MAETLPDTANSTANASGAPHIGDDGSRSSWFAMDADQVWKRYSAQNRTIRITHCAATIILAIVACIAISPSRPWSIGLALTIFLVGGAWILISTRQRLAQQFTSLVAILVQDCDVSKYRALLSQMERRNMRGKDAKRIGIERARCDYYDGNPRSALTEISSLNITASGARNLRIMAANIAANAYHDLGATAQCADKVVELQRFASEVKAGSAQRTAFDNMLADMAVLFTPASEWNAETNAYIRKRLADERTHYSRCSWQLALAEYEALHGNTNEASALLADPGLEPMVPRSRRKRESISQMLVH